MGEGIATDVMAQGLLMVEVSMLIGTGFVPRWNSQGRIF
jgi:hypothetical protein